MVSETAEILLHAVRQRTFRNLAPSPSSCDVDSFRRRTIHMPIRVSVSVPIRSRVPVPIRSVLRSVRTQRSIRRMQRSLTLRTGDPILRGVFFVEHVIWSGVSHIRCSELRIEIAHGLVRLDAGLERRRHLLHRKQLPVDARKERVFLQFCRIALSAQAMFWIAIEQLYDESVSNSS